MQAVRLILSRSLVKPSQLCGDSMATRSGLGIHNEKINFDDIQEVMVEFTAIWMAVEAANPLESTLG